MFIARFARENVNQYLLSETYHDCGGNGYTMGARSECRSGGGYAYGVSVVSSLTMFCTQGYLEMVIGKMHDKISMRSPTYFIAYRAIIPVG